MSTNVLFVISGPSGVGKGTVLADMVEERNDLAYSVSATTRNMRAGEAEGVTYYYKTPEEFEELIESGDVVEWDTYQGNKYGTLVSSLNKSLQTGKNIALDITVPGAIKIKKIYGKRAVLVFVLPPSIEELEKRLIGRNREGTDEIRRRISFAINEEMPRFKEFDFVIVNDNKEVAIDQLIDILEGGMITAEGGEISADESALLEKIEEFNVSDHLNILEEKLNISKYAEKYN